MAESREFIEIDLNVRVANQNTWTVVDPAIELEVGSAYVVGESESGLIFPAVLVERRDDGYAEFDVAWEKGRFAG